MGTMRIMGATGDEPVSWDPENPRDVQKAKRIFTKRLKDGYQAYRVERVAHRTGTPVTEFDPQAGEYLFAMPMAGG
jgi:hypothetical protein